MTGPCPDCGHRHEGPQLAGICVGCPCQTGRPGAARRDLRVDEVTYLRRILTALSDPVSDRCKGDYWDGYRDGLVQALELLDELLAEEPVDLSDPLNLAP